MSIHIITSDGIERAVENEYKQNIKKIVKQLGSGATYTSQLTKYCKKLFGSKYKGTYSSDKLPTLTSKHPYAIVNVDTSSQPGSHWVGCCYTPRGMLIYDSFGRKTRHLMKNIYKKYTTIDTDYDPEQRDSEKNCGSRCISWLIMCDKYGTDIAKLI